MAFCGGCGRCVVCSVLIGWFAVVRCCGYVGCVQWFCNCMFNAGSETSWFCVVCLCAVCTVACVAAISCWCLLADWITVGCACYYCGLL